jgi:polyketide biosynthesis 3-hydroxy-3-methylglutaryl-CoA synthase-like enzyme PksG
MDVGIEAINAYVGRALLDTRMLSRARGLDMSRFDNLMMDGKSVSLPCEDPVSNAVNAAKPLVDALTEAERRRIELVVVGTESGIDFAKPISTYVQHYLGLGTACRSFEVKHACYGGTAALRAAMGIVAGTPGSKALVIAADAAGVADRNTYWEPSQGTGAVAMLVGDRPEILAVDPGAAGFHSREVMDTLRPRADVEAGDSDLSLMSYLEALRSSYARYAERVEGAYLFGTFRWLVFHSPFAGMVKGAHRTLVRGHIPDLEIGADFDRRVAPTLRFCSTVGNTYSAALYLGLCSLLEHTDFVDAARIGLFSYGSGCASEFYSGVVPAGAHERVAKLEIGRAVAERVPLTMTEYELVSDLSVRRMGGVEELEVEIADYQALYDRTLAGRGLLVLDRIRAYHREYRWS